MVSPMFSYLIRIAARSVQRTLSFEHWSYRMYIYIWLLCAVYILLYVCLHTCPNTTPKRMLRPHDPPVLPGGT